MPKRGKNPGKTRFFAMNIHFIYKCYCPSNCSVICLKKIRRPQVKRGFIPNETADILFGGGVVDFVEAFVQNRLQRLQIKQLRFVKKSRIHQPRSQVRQVCARKLRKSRMAIVLPIAVLTYRNFAFLNDESVKIIIA